MATVLITGASRGIGREFARQYAADGWQVLACCRNPESMGELAGDGVSVHQLDVDDGASVAAARETIGEAAIDLLINNAGIIGARGAGLGSMDYTAFEACLRTNVLGPMRVAEAFVDCLARGEAGKLVTISSQMGSISRAGSNAMIYRTSKAAVNMLVKCLSGELRAKRIAAVVMHPGWVQTDMGGAGAALTPSDSVAAMRRVIAGLRLADSGRFLSYDGSEIPW
jgi:NAD(P)-dependent dehydrogenase (short-subunit alcohol dehydrogenase family)